MSRRAVALALIAFVGVAAGCGQARRVLDARVETDRTLVRERTEEREAVVRLRSGEEIRASSIDLRPERTRWTAPGEDGTPMSVDVPTASIRSIRMSVPRPPAWRHLLAGAALGVLAGGVLAADFDDGESDAGLLVWGGAGLVVGGLGALAPRSHTYEVDGGEDPAPPPPR